jgi:hypothetical protein
MDGHQGGGAGGAYADARPVEVEAIGQAGGEEVFRVSQRDVEGARPLPDGGMAQQVMDQIGAQVGAGEDPDLAREALGIAPRILQGLPGGLQEDPLLGIEDLGLAGMEIEELGVE